MIFSFGPCEKLADIVVAKTAAQTERPALGPISLGGWRREDLVQSGPQGGVDDFLERFAQPGSGFPCFGGNIRIKRQGGPHTGIMMP